MPPMDEISVSLVKHTWTDCGRKTQKICYRVLEMIATDSENQQSRLHICTYFSPFFGDIGSCHWFHSFPNRLSQSVSGRDSFADGDGVSHDGDSNEKRRHPFHFPLFSSVGHKYTLHTIYDSARPAVKHHVLSNLYIKKINNPSNTSPPQ